MPSDIKINPSPAAARRQPRHPLIGKRKSWRDLTDEEQWKRIYAGRAARERAKPKTIKEAVSLGFPAYVMYQAIQGAADNEARYVRKDTERAVVASIMKVSSLLPEHWRGQYADDMQKHYLRFRRTGFYTGHTEFLYAAAAATVSLCDRGHYPPDAPALMAAFILKEDAEHDDNDWDLSKQHAIQMAGTALDQYLETGLYGIING